MESRLKSLGKRIRAISSDKLKSNDIVDEKGNIN